MRTLLRSPLRSSLRQSLVRPLTSRSSVFDPVSLFSNGEQGAFYLPEPENLFQDAAGTTPVTADGDPVGLMLDKSGNGKHATQGVSASRPVYPGLAYDGVGGSISAPVPASGLFDLMVAIRPAVDETNFIIATGADVSRYVFAADGSSSTGVSNNSGSPVYVVNGVSVPRSRRALRAAVTNGEWALVEIQDINVDLWGGEMTLSGYDTAGWRFHGDIGDVVFRETMTEDERTNVRKALAAKYGITL